MIFTHRTFIPLAVLTVLNTAMDGTLFVREHEAPPQVVVASPQVTQAQAERLARKSWGSLSQGEINAITAEVNKGKPGQKITLICAQDAWCGDVASDLENAFESAHWQTNVSYSAVSTPSGWLASSQGLANIINDATGGRFAVRPDPGRPVGADDLPDYIAIGQKPRSKS